jgi:hypothetical protein
VCHFPLFQPCIRIHPLKQDTISLLAPLKKLTTIDLLHVHRIYSPLAIPAPSDFSEAVWNGSEQLRIREGCDEVDVGNTTYVKAAREVLQTTGTNFSGESGSTKKGVQKAARGVKDRTRSGKEKQTDTHDENGEIGETNHLRILHRKVYQQWDYRNVELPDVEEWYQELPI